MRHSSKWFIGIKSTQEKQSLEKLLNVLGDNPAVKRLKEILDQRRNELLKTQIQDYDKPSWREYQAHKNGQLAMIDEIKSLLTGKDN